MAINYDLPADADSYLHRVGRAGRFGTKGLSISFVSSEDDEKVLKDIEKRFEVALPYVPDRISLSEYKANHDHSEYPEGGVDSTTYMA